MATAVELNWVDLDTDREVAIGSINPGESLTLDSHAGHKFVAAGQVFVLADNMDLRITGADVGARDEL